MLNSKILEKIQNTLFYVFVFLLPWQTRYIFSHLTLGGSEFEYGKLSIYVSEVVLFFLFFLFTIYWIFFGIKKDKLPLNFLFLFVLLLISSFGYFFTIDKQMFFYGLLKLSELVFLIFIINKINFSCIKVGYSFVSSMFLHSILGIYQFINQNINPNKYLGIAEQVSYLKGPSIIENIGGRFLRAYGGLSHPNIFGGFLVIAVLFMVGIYVTKIINKKIYEKIIFWIIFITLFNALILTFSRSAYLALGISFVFIFIYSIYKKCFNKYSSIFIIVFFISTISLFIFKDIFVTRTSLTQRTEINSNIERIQLLKQSFNIIQERFLYGVSFNNYIPAIYSRNFGFQIYEYQPVHNVYLLVFAELGIIGFLFYLSIFVFSFCKNIKTKDEINIIFSIMILSIFVINLFDHYFWTSYSGVIISFLILFINNKNLQNFS